MTCEVPHEMLMSVLNKTERMGVEPPACFCLSFYSSLANSKFIQSWRGTSKLKCNLMPKMMFCCCLCVTIVSLNISFPYIPQSKKFLELEYRIKFPNSFSNIIEFSWSQRMLHLKKKKRAAWDKTERLQLGEWGADREKKRNHKKPLTFQYILW